MRFRKRPVVIEAWQFHGHLRSHDVPSWLTDREAQYRPPRAGEVYRTSAVRDGRLVDAIEIHAPEGVMVATEGDWIIRGVKGELYPCKPDVFAATYEPEKCPGDSYRVVHEVLNERHRQIWIEGYTPEHDDAKNRLGELAHAAACYAAATERISFVNFWPWPRSRWKPKKPRRNLVRAAALLVAEIERLDRAAAQEKLGGSGPAAEEGAPQSDEMAPLPLRSTRSLAEEPPVARALEAAYADVLNAARHRFNDLHPDGKTILDFFNSWLDQERIANARLRAEIGALREAALAMQTCATRALGSYGMAEPARDLLGAALEVANGALAGGPDAIADLKRLVTKIEGARSAEAARESEGAEAK